MMKHIFFVHSHTLFLTSIGVINKLNLPKEDIIFIYSRNYKNNLGYDYATFDFSKEVEDGFKVMFSFSHKNCWFNKSKRDELVAKVDSFVSDIIHDDFYVYLPNFWGCLFQIFATNTFCKEAFFIQEGGRVMTPILTGNIPWYFRLYNKIVLHGENRMWKCANWFPNDCTPYNKPITVFAFDEKYFGSAPQRIIKVTWPHIDIDIDLNSDWPIFLLEGAVQLGQVEKDVYQSAVEKLIEEFGKENNYIKFHPAQNQEARNYYIGLFKARGLHVEDLPMDIPFELILTNYKQLKLYGFGTSLLFYGKALGHNVVSRENLLLVSKRYRKYSKDLSKL